MSRSMDCIQEALVNKGTVVIKQPDIWSQGRMTKFRKEFEDQMALELTNFKILLAGRVARTDNASFSSQTALAASITPASPKVDPNQFLLQNRQDVSTELTTATGLLTSTSFSPPPTRPRTSICSRQPTRSAAFPTDPRGSSPS